jgi:hypothetical protein
MQPNQPNVQPNTAEMPISGGEANTEKVAEVSVTPEVFVDSAPADPVNVTAASQIDVPAVLVDDDAPSDTSTLVTDIDDTAVISGDAKYFSEVKKIMHDDAEKPYLEEKDSERLQKGYLKERFGVDVDMDKEEKQP